jgi:threonylcarbamoyladenosine tRNA methylthiotransferase MtaB
LENEGFEKREFDDQADVYVINTCSVTENADKECRYLVRSIQRKSPESLVVITGCYAQLKPKEIAEIPGVNLVLGAAEKFNIAQHIRELATEIRKNLQLRYRRSFSVFIHPIL